MCQTLHVQVARCAAIFNVDELVVIDDTSQRKDGTVGAGAAFLARVAQYLETPQYLRKALIPMHPDLRLAGLLPPLDAPHHMRASEWKPYREGLVLKVQPGVGSYVDIGLDRMAFVPQQFAPNTRVTLAVGDAPQVQFMADFGENMIMGKVSSCTTGREGGMSALGQLPGWQWCSAAERLQLKMPARQRLLGAGLL